MIGISLYAGMEKTVEENLLYLNEACEKGIKNIFTSFHIPEANNSYKKEINILLSEARKLDMRVIADVSKGYFNEKEIDKYNFHSLRLDFGFNLKEIAEMTVKYRYNITLNASTLTRKDIETIIKYGGNLERIQACHNFYPREHTGISEELLISRNNVFKEYGIKTMAFVPSLNGKRGPIYEGLPTLEKHRKINPMISAQHLLRLQNDLVFVGDSRASKKELEDLGMIKKDLMLLPVKLEENITKEEEYLLEYSHTNRTDPGEYVIRSQEARNLKRGIIEPNNIDLRNKYCVTIDNSKYERYEGELQILKMSLKKDERVNVVGDASQAGMLIDILKPGEKFAFQFIDK